MREVIRDVGAVDVPEIVVINKADAADPLVLQRLLRIERRSIAVSARTGQGIADCSRSSTTSCPGHRVEIEALVPYTHGKLVARAHAEGEVISEEHTPEGTLLKARVHEELAADLAPYVPAAPDARGKPSEAAVQRRGPPPRPEGTALALCGSRLRLLRGVTCRRTSRSSPGRALWRSLPSWGPPASPSDRADRGVGDQLGLAVRAPMNQPPPDEPPVMVQPMRYIAGGRD